jgi:Flavin containing amine oxidoreductase
VITSIASYLRFFDGVRRRTGRDVDALPPEAVAWQPPAVGGEAGWSIGRIVGHIGGSRLYFARAYRGEGRIATPPEIDAADQRTWARRLTLRIGGARRRRWDNLFFAGEHTSSFYEQQGFMEGAALSGQRAALQVYRLLRG